MTTFRAGNTDPIQPAFAPNLGFLKKLTGTWAGQGFNLVSLPDFQNGKPFQVKTNATRELLQFSAINAPIPNRGNVQGDIEYLGLHYLQQISDATTSGALHIEPGFWLNFPATTNPPNPPGIVRQANIPHGDSLVAIGTGLAVQGGPIIQDASTTPIGANGQPITDPKYLEPLTNATVPPGIPPICIHNPNVLLRNAIVGQNIINTIVLQISTQNQGGIVNIPFIQVNANATRMDATFWIEEVQLANGQVFLQLQYTQMVILHFLNIDWPHISVATLVKQ